MDTTWFRWGRWLAGVGSILLMLSCRLSQEGPKPAKSDLMRSIKLYINKKHVVLKSEANRRSGTTGRRCTCAAG